MDEDIQKLSGQVEGVITEGDKISQQLEESDPSESLRIQAEVEQLKVNRKKSGFIGLNFAFLSIGVYFVWTLTLKAPITTAADHLHKHFFYCFSEKIRLDISYESFARQRIHMKNQALFSSKDKSKKLKCRLQKFLFGTLKVQDKFQLVYGFW